MSMQQRLEQFKTRFTALISGRPDGYDELSNLERPLVGAADDDDYDNSQHGTDGYRPPRVPGEAGEEQADPSGAGLSHAFPTQEDELRELTVLGKDAAEILWEMVVLGEVSTPSGQEMRSNAEQLRAQLRGIISDYGGADEASFASAFEAFEMLSRSLDGEDTSAGNATAAALATVTAVAAAPAAPVVQKPVLPVSTAATAPAAPAVAVSPADEAPLISFD